MTKDFQRNKRLKQRSQIGIIEKRHKDPDGQFDPSDNTYVKIKKSKKTEQSGQISIKKKSHNLNSKESIKK